MLFPNMKFLLLCEKDPLPLVSSGFALFFHWAAAWTCTCCSCLCMKIIIELM